MKRFANFIVEKKIVVMVIAILLVIPSIIGIVGTYINYDILTYLPEDLDSIKGTDYLENDFKIASTAMITVENMADKDVLALKNDLVKIEGVDKVLWRDDVADLTIPKEMLPEELGDFFYSEKATLMVVTFDENGSSESTINAIGEIKDTLKDDCYIGGLSAVVQDTKELSDKEVPIYTLIAIGLLLIVLYLGVESIVIPFLFLAGIGFAILYNFGTNIFLGEISYVTKSLAAVLQLGITMDFSIFLLHRYEEEKILLTNEKEAMAVAIQKTISSITGSSLTTIAGFLAMCTMTLTLGTDIGVVMAKGVVFGLISTVTILPALIMMFSKPIEKYRHKTLIPKLTKTSHFIVKNRIKILIVFVLLLVVFGVAKTKTEVYYTLVDSLPDDLVSVEGTKKLKETFNMTSTDFILVDEQLSNHKINELVEEIKSFEGIEQVISYEEFVGGGLPAEYVPEAIRSIFNSGGKKMIIVNSHFEAATEEQNELIEKINNLSKEYDQEALVTGEATMTKDLIEIADTDFKNVTIASIIAVFVIIALVFKSLSIPIILVMSIEAAITINMGIPYFSGSVMPFISGIVVGTIQLGATVDYAILMTNRFREERRRGHNPVDAAQLAVANCSQSILSSGLAFFAATIGVAMISKIELIQSLCLLVSRGALISMVTIIFVLPALLVVFSKVIDKTSIGWLKPRFFKENK